MAAARSCVPRTTRTSPRRTATTRNRRRGRVPIRRDRQRGDRTSTLHFQWVVPAGGEARQRLAGHAGNPPVRQHRGAERLVEVDRCYVPVENRPLEPPAIAFDGQCGQRL